MDSHSPTKTENLNGKPNGDILLKLVRSTDSRRAEIPVPTSFNLKSVPVGHSVSAPQLQISSNHQGDTLIQPKVTTWKDCFHHRKTGKPAFASKSDALVTNAVKVIPADPSSKTLVPPLSGNLGLLELSPSQQKSLFPSRDKYSVLRSSSFPLDFRSDLEGIQYVLKS